MNFRKAEQQKYTDLNLNVFPGLLCVTVDAQQLELWMQREGRYNNLSISLGFKDLRPVLSCRAISVTPFPVCKTLLTAVAFLFGKSYESGCISIKKTSRYHTAVKASNVSNVLNKLLIP